ncbi:DEAD/DEAH box helicase [Facklamia sp. DSM 111018]|uniref:DEAD/DEAH box helicase n=1 Tax=Facklamia lactis TaxID=2749967 RepID=A0ABS0LRL2_9LACT|nr:DEAD/DEAH box helicase [Facklamia lactis]MBG9986800.1 DEAD/DEAH box helicase [Facklamia lactis]
MIEKLPQELREIWNKNGFKKPSLIQERVFEYLLTQRSLIAISPTGTGKTLAYLLPLLVNVEANNQLQVIIFAPSQELAQQIYVVTDEWASAVGIKCQSLIGGANKKRQIERLKEKPEIVVATPGRFLELIKQTAKLKVHSVKTVVYDEADYLFADRSQTLKEIEIIEESLMRDIHRVYFSATKNDDLERYLYGRIENLSLVEVRSEEVEGQTKHYLVETSNREKVMQLRRLSQLEDMQAIVFFEQINELEMVAAKLLYEGLGISVLHSQVSNTERQLALAMFEQKKTQFLLTTDLASRGLDLTDVPYIIHFNRVQDQNTYLHRSGRTGRMGKEGTVISLVNQQEARDLLKILQNSPIELETRIIYGRKLLKEKPIIEMPAEQILASNKKFNKNQFAKPAKKRNPKKKKQRYARKKNIGMPRKDNKD